MKKKNTLLVITIIVLVSLFLFAPILATILNSFFPDMSTGIPKGFTFDFYRSIFGGRVNMLPSIGRSLLIAIVPTFVMLVVILLSSYVVNVYFPWMDKYIDLLSKIPYGIQGVILAVSIISLYGAMSGIFSNRVLLLGSAYCIVIFPYMYQGVKNALTTIDMMPILEAAETLGASKIKAYFTIIVPSIMKGLIATILLSIGILFGDFVLVNIIAGSYYNTISIFLNAVQSQSGHAASAISIVIFVVMLILTIISNRFNNSDRRNPKVSLVDDKQEEE
jgi:putative spermidine/putrescine transport system permease protein